MTEIEEANLDTVRAYLAALEAGEAGETLGHFFNADYRMIELPNRLNPNGRESDLANAVERSKQGKTVLRQQRYEVVSALAQDDRVAFEVQWTGVLRHSPRHSRSRIRDESPLRHVPRVARRQDQPPAQLRLLRALVAKCGRLMYPKFPCYPSTKR